MFAAMFISMVLNTINVTDGIAVGNNVIMTDSEIGIVQEYMDEYDIDNLTIHEINYIDNGVHFVARYEISENKATYTEFDYDYGFELFGFTFGEGFENVRTTKVTVNRF